MIEFKAKKKLSEARIKVIGVGGGGGNAVNRMVEAGLPGVEIISANTDAQVLRENMAPIKIQLGEGLTRGLGTGGNPEIGKQAALESKELIREVLEGADMVFITAGMGGGTGTGASPVIAEIAKELGALVVAIVTKPFKWEGKPRQNIAIQGINELRRVVDTIIVIPNDKIRNVIPAGEKLSFDNAFRRTDEVLYQAVKGIAEVITTPGIINLDFADVKTVMSHKGLAIMGMGISRGETRAIEAARAAVNNPLMDDVTITGATSALINISGGADLSFHEVEEIAEYITGELDEEANVLFGAIRDDTLEDRVKVVVIATGLKPKEKRKAPSHFVETIPHSMIDHETPAYIRRGDTTEYLFDEYQKKAARILEVKGDDTELPSFLKLKK